MRTDDGEDPPSRKASRPSDPPANQVRSRDQSQNSERAWANRAANATQPRRRGDRIATVSAAVHMSPSGRFCCKSRRSDGFAWNHPVSIRSIESGEDALILATAAVMQHTKHRLVVVEQPVWRAAVGSVR